MSSFITRERQPRPDDFIRDAEQMFKGVRMEAPDPSSDYGMYKAMNLAYQGVHEELEELRRNQGRIGYGAQNLMSDLSKAHILKAMNGDEEDMSYIARAMEMLTEGFNDAVADGALAESANRFGRTIWQEQMEAELFGKIWPVITGKEKEIPELTSRRNFNGNLQAFIYSYIDVVTELSKALNKELFKHGLTTEQEFVLFARYLVIAESIHLRLSQERHSPGYVINNGWGPWFAFSNRLRGVEQCIMRVRDDYNLRLSIQRMIQTALNKG